MIVNILRLEKTRLRLFSDQHGVFKDSGIWQGRSSIELGEMKSAIETIISKLNQFKDKFQQEKEELSKQSWFIAVEKKTDLLSELCEKQKNSVQSMQ